LRHLAGNLLIISTVVEVIDYYCNRNYRRPENSLPLRAGHCIYFERSIFSLKKHIVILAIAAITAALILAGCNSGGSSLAEINGKKVTSDDVVKYMSRNPMANAQISSALTQLLEEELILNLAKEKKVMPTDTQIDQRLNYIKKIADLDEYLKK